MAKRMIGRFEQMANDTDSKLKINPYSDTYEQPQFDASAANYARPPSGSKTEARGIRAGNYILTEVVRLCEIIDAYGHETADGKSIDFGSLFSIYTHISDKVVGLLLRARKHGLVDFEGEMLYQRRDEEKQIRMCMSLDEIRTNVRYSNDPVSCIKIK